MSSHSTITEQDTDSAVEQVATITASDAGIQRLLRDATLADRGEYENAHLTILDGELNVLASGAGSSLSYATFVAGDAFQAISVGEAVTERTPATEQALAEALLDIDIFRSYYELIREPGQHVRLEFYATPGDRLATYVEMYGGLNARLHLPVSEAILQKMPLAAPQKFDDENVWDGNVRLDTHIRTTVDRVRRIIDAVDDDEVTSIDNYPVVVEDGVFKIEVTDDTQRNWVTGALDADDNTVTGPDVANLYGTGFADIFTTLEGPVQLQTKALDGGAPLAVVQEDTDGVVRHVIGPCGTL